MTSTESESDDSFLRNYTANDRRIASEFLSGWLPFLTNGLCDSCNRKLTHRVRSLRPDDDSGKKSVGSGKDGVNDAVEMNSLGSCKDGENGCVDHVVESGANGCSTSDRIGSSPSVGSGGGHISWADMAQEDEVEGDEEKVTSRLSILTWCLSTLQLLFPGPGSSSIGGGAFTELGPFYPKGDGRGLRRNSKSWNKVSNLLFVESPVGVGWSYSITTSDYTRGDDATRILR